MIPIKVIFYILVVLFFASCITNKNEVQPKALHFLNYVKVEGGEFLMGSPDDEPGRDREETQHSVKLDGFIMSTTEISVGDFKQFVDDTKYKTVAERESGGYVWISDGLRKDESANWKRPSYRQNDNFPVVLVSWLDAIEFCNWKSKKEGFEPAYRVSGEKVTWIQTSNGYRLPTEAEWEFAARGGSKSRNLKYSGSSELNDVAWYDKTTKKSHPSEVGSKLPNELGIYDMSGNVCEFCWDIYEPFKPNPATNPTGAINGETIIARGGSWADNYKLLRLATRFGQAKTDCISLIGFRIVRTLM